MHLCKRAMPSCGQPWAMSRDPQLWPEATLRAHWQECVCAWGKLGRGLQLAAASATAVAACTRKRNTRHCASTTDRDTATAEAARALSDSSDLNARVRGRCTCMPCIMPSAVLGVYERGLPCIMPSAVCHVSGPYGHVHRFLVR